MTRAGVDVPIRQEFRASRGGEHAGVGPAVLDWVQTLNDPQLTALVAEAIERNWDLQAAEERLTQARLLAQRAGVTLGPIVDGLAGAAWGDSGRGSTPKADLRIGVGASWELDVWGRVRSARRAAEMDALVAEADVGGVRNAIAAQTAQSWVLLIVAWQRVGVDQETLDIRRRTLGVAQARMKAGVSQPIDVKVATADVADSEAIVLASRQAALDAARSLELLLGRYPGGEIESAAAVPAPLAQVPVGVPSDLLERRPDLVAADRRVAAAFYRREAAKAARLPRLALTGELGTASRELRDVLNPEHVAWSVGANLVAPLLDGGQRKIDVEIAESQQREALSAYAGAGLRAFEEVERAISTEATIVSQIGFLESSVAELERARDAAELRYRRGLLSIFELTQIEARLFGARRELVAARGARVVQRIALHLALGGDFTGSPAGISREASVKP